MSFLTLIYIFLLILLIRFVVRGYMMYRRYKKAMTDAFGFNPFGSARQQTNHSDGRQQTARRQEKKKVFDREDGEYVAYEEVSVSHTEQSAADGSTREVTEEQIIDAEWEDIPAK